MPREPKASLDTYPREVSKAASENPRELSKAAAKRNKELKHAKPETVETQTPPPSVTTPPRTPFVPSSAAPVGAYQQAPIAGKSSEKRGMLGSMKGSKGKKKQEPDPAFPLPTPTTPAPAVRPKFSAPYNYSPAGSSPFTVAPPQPAQRAWTPTVKAATTMNPYFQSNQPSDAKSMPYWQQRAETPRTPPPVTNSWLTYRTPPPKAEPPKQAVVTPYPTVGSHPANRPSYPTTYANPEPPPPPAGPPKTNAWLPNLSPKPASKPEQAEQAEQAGAAPRQQATPVADPAMLKGVDPEEPRSGSVPDSVWPTAEYSANFSDTSWISLKDMDGESDGDTESEDVHRSPSDELDWDSLTGRTRSTNGISNEPAEPSVPETQRRAHQGAEPVEPQSSPQGDNEEHWPNRRRRRLSRSERKRAAAEELVASSARQREEPVIPAVTWDETPVEAEETPGGDRELDEPGLMLSELEEDEVPLRTMRRRDDEFVRTRPVRTEEPVRARARRPEPAMKVRASREAVLVEDDLVYVRVDDEGRPVLR